MFVYFLRCIVYISCIAETCRIQVTLMYNICIILKTVFLHISKLGVFTTYHLQLMGFIQLGCLIYHFQLTGFIELILAAHDPCGMFGHSLLLLMCAYA